MQRLGRALAGPDGDDLVQETWLRVLSHGGSGWADPRRWLATVMRNLARSRARGSARSKRREAEGPRPEPPLATVALVEQAELAQHAVQALLTLEPPLRDVLLLRYQHGLEPDEIAKRLQLPPSTVRNRCARGLDRVREQMDRRHGGDRKAWAALFAAAASTGVVMKTNVVVAAAAAVLLAALAVAWRLASDGAVPAPSKEESAAIEPVSGTIAAPDPDAAPGTASTVFREPSPSATDARAALQVRVVDAERRPIAAMPVSVANRDRVPGRRWLFHTDRAGFANAVDVAPGKYLVQGRGAEAWISVPATGVTVAELVVPRGIDVDVTVVDADQRPVPGAEVWLSDDGNSTEGEVVATTDPIGRTALRDVGRACTVCAYAAGHAPSRQHDVKATIGSRIAITMQLGGPGASLTGTVRSPDGEPIPFAEVLAGPEHPPGFTLPSGDYAQGAITRVVVADEHGRFEAQGLPCGTIWVQGRASGHGVGGHQRVDLVAGAQAADIVLPYEARVAGTVRDESGAPLPGVLVASGSYMAFAYAETTTDAAGTFELVGLTAGMSSDLRATHDRHGSAREQVRLAPGALSVWNPVLSAGAVVGGTLCDDTGTALHGWRVAAVYLDHVGIWRRSAITDEAGTFLLENCPKPPFSLAVTSPKDRFGEPVLLHHDVVLGMRDLQLVAPRNLHPNCMVRGRAVDATGAAVPFATVSVGWSASPSFRRTETAAADGTFRLGPLRPERYDVRVDAEGLAPAFVPGFELRSDDDHDLGDIALARPGFVRIRASTGSHPVPGIESTFSVAVVDPESGAHLGSIEIADQSGKSTELPPGRVRIVGRASAWCATDVEVEVEGDKTVDADLAFVPATSRALAFVLPARDPARRIECVVRDGAGHVVARSTAVPGRDNALRSWIGGLVPGTYTVHATTDTGLAGNAAFVVTDLRPDANPIRIELR